jgi:hypothetical protein
MVPADNKEMDDAQHWIWGLLVTAYVLLIVMATLAI